MEPQESPDPEVKTIRGLGMAFLVAVQIAMLVVLNIFDYSYIFPSRSGLTMGYQLLFSGIYVVALVWGCIYAVRHFHWTIGLAQVVTPLVLWIWLAWPQHYNPTKYQFLVGMTQAEVEETIGRKGITGFEKNEDGVFVHYNGMRIRYAVRPDNRLSPESNDRVIAVDPFP